MSTKSSLHRPYAPTSSVIAFCQRARSRNLPDRVSEEFFQLAGVRGQSARRARQALAFLGLLDEDGTPTKLLHDLAVAPGEDWRGHLQEAVQTSYADDLANVDPAKDDPATLRGWFQRYEPRSQTGPMTSLFIGLCREGGMEVLDPPRPQSAGRRPTTKKRARTSSSDPGSSQDSPSADSPLAQGEPAPKGEAASTSGLLNITPEMIGELNDDEFEQVWSALGVVARAHARLAQDKEASEERKDSEHADE